MEEERVVTEKSGTTGAKFREFVYNWTIDWGIELINYQKLGTSLESDPFETEPGVSWQAVYKCVDEKPKCGLKFLGCPVLGPCFSMAVTYGCAIGGVYVFEPINRVFCSQSKEHYENMSKDNGFTYKLKLEFEITTRKLSNFIISPSTLLQDLGSAMKNSLLTEVDLKIGSLPTVMKAHKEILAARSPVFAAMFNANMLENHQNSITIGDIDDEVFEQTLKYIYTDTANIEEISVASLLVAADKYDLKRLVAACEHAIFRRVNASTAIDGLILADTHNAQQLKAHLLKFIRANGNQVMRENGWKSLVKHPKLLLEVHQAIAKK